MKISLFWLKELIDLNISIGELINLLPLRSVSIKDVNDGSIELDMKGYNRADLLSLRGVAQEVAAITNSQLKFTDDEVKPEFGVPDAKVIVDNPKLAPVYCIAKIENLKVEQSADTWVKKLSDCGIRSVNNVADVTNLIMMEYGQPMHAFDARAVKDEEIIVKEAREGERITTLDGKTRDLETSDLLITDSLNALGIAGVMGGKDSEITESTTTILLEAAIFDPVNIRRTATRLGLQSEASKRFQHGLTKKRLLQALDTAIKMYQDLGGKLTAISIVGDLVDPVKKVHLTQKKLNSLIGIEIKPADVDTYLKKLGFKLTSPSESGNVIWEVTIPYFRLDIDIEEDLIEEVARMYGYEKIPSKELVGEIPPKIDQSLFNLLSDLKTALVEQGLTEVQTYSFYSTDVLNNLEWEKNKLVKIANPISSETEYLRQDLWPNLLEVVSKNLRAGVKDVAIFELGKVFNLEDSEPTESYRLSLALCDGSDDPTPKLYQIFKNVAKSLGVKLFHPPGGRKAYEQKYFHPTRFSFLEKEGKNIGGIAEVHPRFVNRFGIEKRVAVLEIEVDSSLRSE